MEMSWQEVPLRPKYTEQDWRFLCSWHDFQETASLSALYHLVSDMAQAPPNVIPHSSMLNQV
eukprot:1154560-Pelagomonas_calceolata.AAC.1